MYFDSNIDLSSWFLICFICFDLFPFFSFIWYLVTNLVEYYYFGMVLRWTWGAGEKYL